MKKLLQLTYVGIMMLATILPANSMRLNDDKIAFLVKEKNVEKVGDRLLFHLLVDVSGMEVSSSHSVVCTPLIEYGDSIRTLTPIMMNGRVRHHLYQRTGRERLRPLREFAYQRRKGEQMLDYRVEIPYLDWMRLAKVSVIIDECGCGWKELYNSKSPLFALSIDNPVVISPMLAYLAPEAEVVKARKLEGKAFLDFPVNRTEIHPDYRKNPNELEKIRRTIDEVRGDKYATITAVTIKGYASPEGSYENNAYLAKHRAKALLDYVKGLYDFGDADLSVDFEPEDWAGLERAIENGNLPDKGELLSIIRAEKPADWDAREWKLKSLNGGVSYKELLRDVYPGLRHSDYEVSYHIRNFSVDEARELIFSDPSKLSLNEMFLVAQTLEMGSDKFNEIFEISVRLYPSDPISNLNAAITAIGKRDLPTAKRYLAKAPALPERDLAEAAIAMLEGRFDDAESILTSLVGKDNVGVAAKNNLMQIKSWRESM